jgi:Ala-tRNA(Pro) deacylase
MKYLGVAPGAVSPFSLINDSDRSVSFVLDKKLLGHCNIFLHPLNNTQTTCVTTQDFLRFVRHTGHPLLCLSLDTPERITIDEYCRTYPRDCVSS